MLGIKPGAAGPGRKYPNHFAMLPPSTVESNSGVKFWISEIPMAKDFLKLILALKQVLYRTKWSKSWHMHIGVSESFLVGKEAFHLQ